MCGLTPMQPWEGCYATYEVTMKMVAATYAATFSLSSLWMPSIFSLR